MNMGKLRKCGFCGNNHAALSMLACCETLRDERNKLRRALKIAKDALMSVPGRGTKIAAEALDEIKETLAI